MTTKLVVADPGAELDLGPPGLRGPQAQPHADEGEGLVDDVVGRDEEPARFEGRVPRGPGGVVRRIGGVRARHPARGVDEERLHDPYRMASCSAAERPSRERPTAAAP